MSKKLETVTLPLPDKGSVNAERATRWQTYQLEEKGVLMMGLSLHDQHGRAIVTSFTFDELASFQQHLHTRAMEIDQRHKRRPHIIGLSQEGANDAADPDA